VERMDSSQLKNEVIVRSIYRLKKIMLKLNILVYSGKNKTHTQQKNKRSLFFVLFFFGGFFAESFTKLLTHQKLPPSIFCLSNTHKVVLVNLAAYGFLVFRTPAAAGTVSVLLTDACLLGTFYFMEDWYQRSCFCIIYIYDECCIGADFKEILLAGNACVWLWVWGGGQMRQTGGQMRQTGVHSRRHKKWNEQTHERGGETTSNVRVCVFSTTS